MQPYTMHDVKRIMDACDALVIANNAMTSDNNDDDVAAFDGALWDWEHAIERVQYEMETCTPRDADDAADRDAIANATSNVGNDDYTFDMYVLCHCYVRYMVNHSA